MSGLAFALAAVLPLGGCGLIMGEHLDPWTFTVTNQTSADLDVWHSGTDLGSVAAGASEDFGFSRAKDTCYPGITARTGDESSIAILDGAVCEGDTWVIEQSDLVPIEDTIYAPSS
jgi:hypothetical protein